MPDNTTRIGIIGCGEFALFAAPFFEQVAGVSITAICEPNAQQADRAQKQLGVPNTGSAEELADRDDVDLVYIATPPFLHYANTLAVLRQSKHVICEKPMAVSQEQADEMVALARDRKLLLATNLMQRYNPLFAQVCELIDSKLLGEPLHGFFENYARDEQLGPSHWFWQEEASGGIFVEHSVHFFDLFSGWLGPGEVEAAQRCLRPPEGLEDQVHCTLRYENDVLVDFYHGFTQPTVLDRQEMRILFERGDLRLFEWVPTHGQIYGLADTDTLERLAACFDDVRVEILQQYHDGQRRHRGRHKSFEADCRFRLEFGGVVNKTERYGLMLREMLTDQVAWIHDHRHVRRITEENGYRSLTLAIQARCLAQR